MKLQSKRERRQTLKAYNAKGEAVSVVVPGADVPDELNPAYLFSTAATALLMRVASGEVNAQALALDMLANRGLDPATGRWVGFDEAQRLADAAKDQAGIL